MLDRLERALDETGRERSASSTASTASSPAPSSRPRAARSSKREPFPSSDSSSSSPPSAWASSRAIARPSPVPCPSRDQNGRKIRSRSSGPIPGPESATRDGDRPVRGGRARATIAPAVGRPVERVVEQVGDDLQHAVAVGVEHRVRVHEHS